MRRNICIAVFVMMLLSVLALSLGCQTPVEDVEDITTPEPDVDWEPGPKPTVITSMQWAPETSSYVAVSHWNTVLSEKAGVEGHLIPIGQSLSRMAAVADGTADWSLNDPSAAFYFYGLGEAADMDWGPQPVRRLITIREEPATAVMFTSDPENIKSPADLVGRNVGQLEGTYGYSYETLSFLATGGVYKDDVNLIYYPSIPALLDAFLTKEVDVMYVQNPAPPAVRMDASPIGANLLPLNDPNAEENLRKHDALGINFITDYVSADGYGTLPDGSRPGPDNPFPSLGRNNPLVTCYEQTDTNMAYWILKLHSEHYDDFMENPPQGGVFTEHISLEKQLEIFDVIPWHEGAIYYLKEVGVWTEEMEAHNQMLLQREQDLQTRWAEVVAEAEESDISGADFEELWTEEVDKLMVSWGI